MPERMLDPTLESYFRRRGMLKPKGTAPQPVQQTVATGTASPPPANLLAPYLAETANMRQPGSLVTPRRTPAGAPNMTRENMLRPPLLSAMNPAPGGYALRPGMTGGGGLNLAAARPASTVAAAAAAPVAPPQPTGPFPTPQSASEFAQRWNEPGRGNLVLNPVTGKMDKDVSKSARGSRALPTMSPEGVPGVQLVGSQGAFNPSPEQVAKRQAYLDSQAKARAAKQASIQGAITARGQERGAARRARIDQRQAGPSVADAVLAQVAQQDPAAAAQLIGLSNYRGADLSLRRELGIGDLNVRREESQARRAELGSANQQREIELANQELEAAAAIRGTNPARAKQLETSAMERRQRASASTLGAGTPGAQAGAPSNDQTPPPTATLTEFPPDFKDRLDTVTPAEADRTMRSAGVDDQSRRSYLQQRENEQRGGLGKEIYDRSGGLFRTLIDALVGMNPPPPIVRPAGEGINPDVWKRLTTEQRRKLSRPTQ